MAPRDPNRPQADFPQLVADLIAELRLGGQVGLLDFNTSIQPVYIVSARGGALAVTATPPVWTSAEIFNDFVVTPALNSVLVDTGQLAEGEYDVISRISIAGQGPANGEIQLQIRDAANAVTLAVPLTMPTTALNVVVSVSLPLVGIKIATNERLRIQVVTSAVTGVITCVIMAKRRVAP